MGYSRQLTSAQRVSIAAISLGCSIGCGLLGQSLRSQIAGDLVRDGLVLSRSGGFGDVQVRSVSGGSEVTYQLSVPTMVYGFTGDGKGVVGRNKPYQETAAGSYEFVTIGIDGRVGITFRIDEHSGTPRVAVTDDLTRLAVCGRFNRGTGTISVGIYGMSGPARIFDLSETAFVCDQLSWNPKTLELAVGVGSEIVLIDTDPMHVISRWRGSLPAWARDGKRIAFRNATGLICIRGAEASEPLCYRQGAADFIVWSPTGDYLAFGKPDVDTFRTNRSILRVSDGAVLDVWSSMTVFRTPYVGWLKLRPEEMTMFAR